jgi:hypothetical protein
MADSVGIVAIKLDKCLRLCRQNFPFHQVFQTVASMPNKEREKLIKILSDFENLPPNIVYLVAIQIQNLKVS